MTPTDELKIWRDVLSLFPEAMPDDAEMFLLQMVTHIRLKIAVLEDPEFLSPTRDGDGR